MRYLFLICGLFVGFFNGLHAQSIEFAPEGAVWRYTRINTWGPPVFEEVEIRYTEDIDVDGIPCKRLVSPSGDYFIYQSGDRVYHRSDTGMYFTLLWDFGVMPGDTFVTRSHFIEGKQLTFVCVGRDTVIENGVLLPRIDLDLHCQVSPNWVERITVNPRYGPMYKQYCPIYLFNTYDRCVVDFFHSYQLLNYTDTEFPSVLNCPTNTESPTKRPVVGVSPNPTSGQVSISNLPQHAAIRLYDALGRVILCNTASNGVLDLAAFPNGLYILEVVDEYQSSGFVRLVKI